MRHRTAETSLVAQEETEEEAAEKAVGQGSDGSRLRIEPRVKLDRDRNGKQKGWRVPAKSRGTKRSRGPVDRWKSAPRPRPKKLCEKATRTVEIPRNPARIRCIIRASKKNVAGEGRGEDKAKTFRSKFREILVKIESEKGDKGFKGGGGRLKERGSCGGLRGERTAKGPSSELLPATKKKKLVGGPAE